MTDARQRRQRAIADLIRGSAIASQEEVTERLSAAGFVVTQATVSRDLDQLGAVKVKRGGTMCYVLPDAIGDSDWAAARLRRLFAEWVLSVETSGQMLVLKTPPGSAHILGVALDQAKLPEVAGTISGDDTLFVALKDGVVPGMFAHQFRKMMQAES